VAQKAQERSTAEGARRLLIPFAALLLAALVLGPAVATSAPPRYPMKADRNVHTGPSTAESVMGEVFKDEMVEIHCQDRGMSIGGSTLWDFIQYRVDGTDGLVKRGWVPDYYVKTGITDPLDGVRQGDCPAPLTEPGPPVPPPPVGEDDDDDNGLPAGCRPLPTASHQRMTAAIRRGKPKRRRSRRAVTTSYRKSVRIQGRLSRQDGSGVPGAGLCLVSRVAVPHAPLKAIGIGATDEQGAFSYSARGGPSREIGFVHPTPRGAVAASVLVRVRAAVSLNRSHRSLHNGETIGLRGRLKGGPERNGVVVELQGRRDSGWQTVDTARTNEKGKYRGRYTFSNTYTTARFKFRARVPKQQGFPYATGTSRKVRVKVRP
jgi:uncharacterized protein YraI